MEYQNLRFLQDVFFYTQQVYSWTMTQEDQLLFSNCPEEEYFYDLFLLSGCSRAIHEHFTRSDVPILTADSIGFVWIAVHHQPAEEDSIPLLQILGPVFLSAVTETHLRRHLIHIKSTPEQEKRLLEMVQIVPTLQLDSALRISCMLHYSVNHTVIPQGKVVIQNPGMEKDELDWNNSRWHGSWVGEQRFFQSVMEGRPDGLREFSGGQVGEIGGGDPLRQAKNEIIVLSVLCSRAAILGGVSEEGALNLEDFYIQQVEAARTVPETRQIGYVMHQDYVERVQRTRSHQDRSLLVRACTEYVETHILEKIRVKDIAGETGYTENYISSSFKAEMGESLLEYVNRRKIEMAMKILDSMVISIAELSDRLAFANPSYFSAVFKKITGKTPAEYQRKKKA